MKYLLDTRPHLSVLQFRHSPEKMVKICVEAALDSGGSDNITVIAIRVEENGNES